MFDVEFKSEAIAALRKMKPYFARQILDAVDTHLRHEPERTSKTRIKKLRGKQQATFRLRVGSYRVFYDVLENLVSVSAILHKDKTPKFCEQGEEP
jgi:mRNA-degrading endonuclease RelE of RelBE toxin-antitoxin system